jgi:hypothetical protein
MFISLCEFYVVLEYAEMNYKFVYGVFIMYSKVKILVIWNNHEYGVLRNYKVKLFRIRVEIVNVCML